MVLGTVVLLVGTSWSVNCFTTCRHAVLTLFQFWERVRITHRHLSSLV